MIRFRSRASWNWGLSLLTLGAAGLTTLWMSAPVQADGPVAAAPATVQPQASPNVEYQPIVDVMSVTQVIRQENYAINAHLDSNGSDTRARLVFDQTRGRNFHFIDLVLREGRRHLEYGIAEGGVERLVAISSAQTWTTGAKGLEMSIRRRGFLTAVIVDGRTDLVSLAPAAPPVSNEINDREMGFTGGYRVLTGAAQFDRVEMSTQDSLLFKDTFMRAEMQSDSWQLVRGGANNFKVESLRNPLLSANAFVQLGYGKQSMLLIGRPEWDQYDYSASLRGPWESSIGLVLCAVEPGLVSGEGIQFQANKDGRKFDPDARYLVFEWQSNDRRPDGDPDLTPEDKAKPRRGGVMRLCWVSGDPDNPKVESIAEHTGGYLPGQWYRVRATVHYGRVDLYIDNNLLLSAQDPAIVGGRIGLYADVKNPPEGLHGATHEFAINNLHELLQYYGAWDDVEVLSRKTVGADYRGLTDLTIGAPAGRPITPLILAEGSVLPGAADSTAKALPAQPAGLRIRGGHQAVWGSPEWSKQIFAATLDLTAVGRAGLFYNYVSPADYEALAIDRNNRMAILGRCKNGQWEELDRQPCDLDGVVGVDIHPQDRYLRVTLTAAQRPAVVLHSYSFPGVSKPLPTADKTPPARVPQDRTDAQPAEPAPAAKGRVGFFCDGGLLSVVNFAVTPVQKDAVFTTSSAIFGHEETMSAWNSFSSEWTTQKDNTTGSTVYWHQAFFPGDVSIGVHPVSFDKPDYEIALSVAKTAKRAVRNNGYVLSFTAGKRTVDTNRETPIRHELKIRLMRDGELVAETDAAVAGEITQFSIRRAGPYIIGGINDGVAFAWRDPAPLEGNKVAYKITGLTLADADTQITSNDIDDQRFESAPVDWRTSLYGVLEVTNRWQCDPRWSFCSLFAPSMAVSQIAAQQWPHAKRIACMWNKKDYPGDVVIELYAGTKMNKDRGGNYQYRRDMNIQLCSDGQSLSKGYTVMYGGLNNQGSYVLRNGEIVYQNTLPNAAINFAGGMHRHWFFIRVEKVGNTIKMSVDGQQKIITGTDEKPVTGYIDEDMLKGGRIAIWTYDNGLMIARVRISGDGGKTWETPDVDYSADEDCPVKN